MKKAMNLVTVFCFLILGRLVSGNCANNIANILDGQNAHPKPLPNSPPSKKLVLTSVNSLYQGARHKNDKRVFRKQFDYPTMLEGQKVVCDGLFDCVISHIAIESTEAIPVLLRGGAGYRHFTAIIKSKPYHALKGQVRAYCKKTPAELEEAEKLNKPSRRFNFGDRLAKQNWT